VKQQQNALATDVIGAKALIVGEGLQSQCFFVKSCRTTELHGELAAALCVPDDKLRLIIRDVGGNFGARGQIFAEQMLVAWAARKVGRPVKWTSDRSEALLSDYQFRHMASTGA
jgi:CO/xanthine dehydrogenase Mo-binding subunit